MPAEPGQLPTVWMYGGGRQSIMIAIMIKEGRIPKPDIACIADTGREKARTWWYLENIVQPALDFTIHRVPKSEFATVDLWGGKDGDSLLIPAFTNINGGVSKLELFCSNEWKARVCDRWLKRVMGVKKWVSWIGFSIDEPKRFNPKRNAMGDLVWFPLVDGVKMGKADCKEAVTRYGWPEPQHSACYHCPLQSDEEWQQNSPEDQASAIQLDNEIRERDPSVFLHRSCKPLADVKFEPKVEQQKELCDSGLCFV